MSSVDIVVPTFQNSGELEMCLDSIDATGSREVRVLVCVDGSTDDTLGSLGRTSHQVPVVVLEHDDHQNHGRSAARNLALPHLRSEFVLLLDSDMRLEPGALDRHLELLARDADVVSVGDVVYLNAADNLWARYVGTRGKNKARHGEVLRPLDFVTANTAMRTADLVALRGFDATLAGYGGEDTELALRLAAELRRRFVFNASARAVTVEDKTIDQGLAELRRYASTNLRVMRARHPDAPAPFWIDRAESRRPLDRLLRLLLNPMSDRIADALLPRMPWAIQRQILSYKVIRSVFAGYLKGDA